jgi:hypothetical protein
VLLLVVGGAFVRFPVGLNKLGGIIVVTGPGFVAFPVLPAGDALIVPGGTLIMLPGGSGVPELLPVVIPPIGALMYLPAVGLGLVGGLGLL